MMTSIVFKECIPVFLLIFFLQLPSITSITADVSRSMVRRRRWVDVDDEAPDPKVQQQQPPARLEPRESNHAPYNTLTKLVGEFDKDIPSKVSAVNDITNLQSAEASLANQQRSSGQLHESFLQKQLLSRRLQDSASYVTENKSPTLDFAALRGVGASGGGFSTLGGQGQRENLPDDEDGRYIPIAKATAQGYTNALEKLYTRQATSDVPGQRRTVFNSLAVPEGLMDSRKSLSSMTGTPEEQAMITEAEHNFMRRLHNFRSHANNEAASEASMLPVAGYSSDAFRHPRPDMVIPETAVPAVSPILNAPVPVSLTLSGVPESVVPAVSTVPEAAGPVTVQNGRIFEVSKMERNPIVKPIAILPAPLAMMTQPHRRPAEMFILPVSPHRRHHRHHHHHHHHHRLQQQQDMEIEDIEETPPTQVCHKDECKNGGSCNIVDGSKRCTCTKGYRGITCEEVSLCHPDPCKHGGTCSETDTGYVCTCPPVAIGEHCETLSHCHPNPCRNNGYCYETGNSFKCSCAYGFKGATCALSSFCQPTNPCLNSGICSEDNSNYKCSCSRGFTGTNCESKRSTCLATTCQNGGTCTDEGGQLHCACSDGFKGRFCEEKVFRPCTAATCLFGGSCIETSQYEYQCLCSPGRTGKRCSAILDDPCSHCHINAKCTENGCVCRDGFMGNGVFCERVPNKCHPNPCENGGQCVDKYWYLDEHDNQNNFNSPYSTYSTNNNNINNKNINSLGSTEPSRSRIVLDAKFLENNVPQTLNPETMHDENFDAQEVVHLHPSQHEELHGPASKTYNDLHHRHPHDDTEEHVYAQEEQSEPFLREKYGNDKSLNDGSSKKKSIVKKDVFPQPFVGNSNRAMNKFQNGPQYQLQELLHQTQDVTNSSSNGTINSTDMPSSGTTYPLNSISRKRRNVENTKRFQIARNIIDDFIDVQKLPMQDDDNGISNRKLPFYLRYRREEEDTTPLNVDKNVLNFNGYACACARGFKGEHCQDTEPCHPNPCRNGGTCIEFDDVPHCECQHPYVGLMCNMTNSCLPQNPCLNGGICQDENGMASCSCKQRFHGGRCEIDKCGKCSPFAICGSNGICKCRNGYIGNGYICEEDAIKLINACHPNPCQDQGSCTRTENGVARCVCNPLRTGKYCEEQHIPAFIHRFDNDIMNIKEKLDNDLSIKLRGNTASTPLVREQSIHNSKALFTPVKEVDSSLTSKGIFAPLSPAKNVDIAMVDKGVITPVKDVLSTDVMKKVVSDKEDRKPANALSFLDSIGKYCHPNPCLNDGVCMEESNTYGCKCLPQYLGAHCEEDRCVKCHVQATCNEGKCTCREGYHGDGHNCEKNPCDGGCPPNSTCQDEVCVCNTGYIRDGDLCAQDFCGEKCVDNSVCKHGHCVCVPGYYKDGPICRRNLCDHKCPLYSECLRGECKCNKGYVKDDEENSCKKSLCEHECPPHSDCDAYGVCFCHLGYFKQGDQCVKSACQKACPAHSKCDGGFCVCEEGYYKDNGKCKVEEKDIKVGPAPVVEKPFHNPFISNYLNTNPHPHFELKMRSSQEDTEPKRKKHLKSSITSSNIHYPSPVVGISAETKNKAIKTIRYPSPDEFRYHVVGHGGRGGEEKISRIKYPDPEIKPIMLEKEVKLKDEVKYPHPLNIPKDRASFPSVSLQSTDNTDERISKKATELKALGLPNKVITALLGTIASKKAAAEANAEDLVISVYKNLGCWKDADLWSHSGKRAIPSIEGSTHRLRDDYKLRKDPIGKCADTTKELGYKIFAIQNGGQCFASANAEQNYKMFGPSEECVNGLGGPSASDVYAI